MLPTLRDLHQVLGADLEPVSPVLAQPIEVSAVHISEIPDPTRFLDGGELLLTTGLTMELSTLQCRSYAERLVRVGVAGLGFGRGPAHGEVPEQLIRACEQTGLPLFSIPDPTPFLTISRAYWSMLAESSQREMAATLSIHRALIAAALSAHPVKDVLRRLAAAADGWAAHVSSGGDVLGLWPADRCSAVRGLEEAIASQGLAGMPTAASLAIGGEEVILQPFGGDRLLGYIAVGCARPISPVAQQVIMTAVALLSLESVHAHRVRTARRVAPSALIGLLRNGETQAARHTGALAAMPLPDGPVRLAALIGAAPAALLDAVDRMPLLCEHLIMSGLEGGTGWLLLRDTADCADWLRRILRSQPEAKGAIGAAVELEDLAPLFGRVRRSALRTGPGTIVDTAETGTSLRSQLDSPQLRAWADWRLTAIVESGRAELLATLVAFLRHRGDWEPMARELGVHRHTARNRVGRIAELLDADLEDADVASELWLALRLSNRA